MSTTCNSTHQEPAGVAHRCELPAGHADDHQDAFVRWPARQFAVLTPTGPREVHAAPESASQRLAEIELIPAKPGHVIVVEQVTAPRRVAFYRNLETGDLTEIGDVDALARAKIRAGLEQVNTELAAVLDEGSVAEAQREQADAELELAEMRRNPAMFLREWFTDLHALREMLKRSGAKFQEHKASEWLAPKVAAVRKPAVKQILILAGDIDVSFHFDADGKLVDVEAAVGATDLDRFAALLVDAPVTSNVQREERLVTLIDQQGGAESEWQFDECGQLMGVVQRPLPGPRPETEPA